MYILWRNLIWYILYLYFLYHHLYSFLRKLRFIWVSRSLASITLKWWFPRTIFAGKHFWHSIHAHSWFDTSCIGLLIITICSKTLMIFFLQLCSTEKVGRKPRTPSFIRFDCFYTSPKLVITFCFFCLKAHNTIGGVPAGLSLLSWSMLKDSPKCQRWHFTREDTY